MLYLRVTKATYTLITMNVVSNSKNVHCAIEFAINEVKTKLNCFWRTTEKLCPPKPNRLGFSSQIYIAKLYDRATVSI